MNLNDSFFLNNYNTMLPLHEEAKFQKWLRENKKYNDLYDYDLRGLWQQTSGKMLGAGAHGPDTF